MKTDKYLYGIQIMKVNQFAIPILTVLEILNCR